MRRSRSPRERWRSGRGAAGADSAAHAADQSGRRASVTPLQPTLFSASRARMLLRGGDGLRHAQRRSASDRLYGGTVKRSADRRRGERAVRVHARRGSRPTATRPTPSVISLPATGSTSSGIVDASKAAAGASGVPLGRQRGVQRRRGRSPRDLLRSGADLTSKATSTASTFPPTSAIRLDGLIHLTSADFLLQGERDPAAPGACCSSRLSPEPSQGGGDGVVEPRTSYLPELLARRVADFVLWRPRRLRAGPPSARARAP